MSHTISLLTILAWMTAKSTISGTLVSQTCRLCARVDKCQIYFEYEWHFDNETLFGEVLKWMHVIFRAFVDW